MKHINPPDNLPLVDDEDVHFRDSASSDNVELLPSSDAAHDASGLQTHRSPAIAPSQPNDEAMAESKRTPSPASLLDTEALCALLLVSRDTAYRLVERDELRCFRIGSKLRFRMDDIEEYLRRCRASRSDRYGNQKD
jgi:excisionase family DNA binding protein